MAVAFCVALKIFPEPVDHQVDAFAAGRLQHLVDPARIAVIDREIGAVLLQPLAMPGIARRADDKRRRRPRQRPG